LVGCGGAEGAGGLAFIAEQGVADLGAGDPIWLALLGVMYQRDHDAAERPGRGAAVVASAIELPERGVGDQPGEHPVAQRLAVDPGRGVGNSLIIPAA